MYILDKKATTNCRVSLWIFHLLSSTVSLDPVLTLSDFGIHAHFQPTTGTFTTWANDCIPRAMWPTSAAQEQMFKVRSGTRWKIGKHQIACALQSFLAMQPSDHGLPVIGCRVCGHAGRLIKPRHRFVRPGHLPPSPTSGMWNEQFGRKLGWFDKHFPV